MSEYQIGSLVAFKGFLANGMLPFSLHLIPGAQTTSVLAWDDMVQLNLVTYKKIIYDNEEKYLFLGNFDVNVRGTCSGIRLFINKIIIAYNLGEPDSYACIRVPHTDSIAIVPRKKME